MCAVAPDVSNYIIHSAFMQGLIHCPRQPLKIFYNAEAMEKLCSCLVQAEKIC